MIPNIPFENFFSYSPMAYDMVAHVLTLGYAVMLAALFYFILTMKSVAPKYRISSVLSVVVMVSAFLLLYAQAQNWDYAFVYDEGLNQYVRADGASTFTNGYRYLNWLIDVPMLLFQILFVINITGDKFASTRNQFFFSGAMMIITGYIGQYYEVSNAMAFYVWGAISTLFFFHVLYLMKKILDEGKIGMAPGAAKLIGTIWTLFLVSWMLYPGAYLMPAITANLPDGSGVGILPLLDGETAVVARSITYTVADVSSKVIYGILLTVAAQIRSKEEANYDYDTLDTVS
ncbi:bacteriorhodopsin [Rubrivirga sp.]|uniref:bacteriorhodopsin n=1 Tax=Rubrivirga sp. TaxID=1885344 RepID=UPI003C71DD1E